MNFSGIIQTIFLLLKDYIGQGVNKIVNQSIEKVSRILSAIFTLVFIFFIFFVLSTISAALWVGEYFGKLYMGFLVVSLFYLLIGIVLYTFKNQIIKKPLSKLFFKTIKEEFPEIES
jgi:hypothetical protein